MSQFEDKKINEALLKNTDEAVKLKNMVWENIEKELNLNDGKGKVIEMKSKKKNKYGFIKYGSIAAVLAIAIVSNTEYGHAAANKIKELFAPNKVISEQIEGMDEKNNATLQEGSSKYIIYIDEERYTMENKDGKDIIRSKAQAENAPEVFMEIYQIENKKPEVVASEIEKSLKEKYEKVKDKENVTTPIEGVFIYANSGGVKWDDTVEKYYLVDNQKGGTFIFRQHFFFEASEGHGVRFDNIIKEFKILND